jgi:hypothetical protein
MKGIPYFEYRYDDERDLWRDGDGDGDGDGMEIATPERSTSYCDQVALRAAGNHLVTS